MKIAVWSPTPYSGRKSSQLLLFALCAIAKEGGEQLVIHADEKGSGPEHYLLAGKNRKRMMERKEFGVEYLNRVLHCERFSKEAVINASYSFAEGKLHVLPAGTESFYRGRETAAAMEVAGIMQRADEVFQNVWVEVPAGDSELSGVLCSMADCVIVNLIQSPLELEKAVNHKETASTFFVLGAYEPRCIYTWHNLTLLFPTLRGRCATIPYHAGYHAACCEGKAENFFCREMERGEEGPDTFFGKETEKAYEKWKEWVKKEHVGKDKEEENTGTTGI